METLLGLDYPTWWFLVVGGLFSGYAILDGFDFGAGALHLFLLKEEERRIALNAIGPVWDGNEVWLVIGGGALFAGFPVMYATLFSAMYTPFMLFLVLIIFRAISIEFRGKEPGKLWRKTWDVSYFVSSILLGFLLGVVLGNVLQGIAIDENFKYHGEGFFDFLNPFAILVGLTAVALFTVHGAIYLLLKTEGRLYLKLILLLRRAIAIFIVFFMATSAYMLIFIKHLSADFFTDPLLFLPPLLTMLSVANVPRLAYKQRYRSAFLFTTLTIALTFVLVAVELYPVLLYSTISPQYNITIYNAASSLKSLKIMLTIVAIGAPLVLAYTIFVYRTFWGKVKLDKHSY